MSADPGWGDLADGLPVHAAEVVSAHEGRPTVAEQNAANGAPAPAVDRGGDCG